MIDLSDKMFEPSNEVMSLNPIGLNQNIYPLTLIHLELIECNSIEPTILPTFLNDNLVSQYLNVVEPSSTIEY